MFESERAPCSIGARNFDAEEEGRDEGTEGACGGAAGERRCWRARRPPSAERRRLQALRRPAGSPRTRNPRTSARRKRKKGAFFKSINGDVFYTVCVKFPSGKNLCAQAQEAEQGTLYVNKITSNIPGKHVVTWFVKGKKVGSFAFRSRASAAPLIVVGFDTATDGHRRLRLARRRGPARVAARALRRRAGPRHATALLERGRARRPRRPAAGSAVDLIAVGARPRLLHRPAGRDRHRPRPRRQPGLPAARRLHARRARRAGSARRRATAQRPRRPRRSARRGLRGALRAPTASGSGSRWSAAPRSSPSGSPSCPSPRWPPDRGRYDFATSWPRRRPRYRTTPIPSTGSPRGTSAPSAAAGRRRPSRLAPIYLRPPDAERWRERDTFQRAE